MSAHAEQVESEIYITGLVYRPSSPGIGAHVHVWGVDKYSKQVFFATTFVQFSGSRSHSNSTSYIVSIQSAQFNKAKKIFVTFHSESDEESELEH